MPTLGAPTTKSLRVLSWRSQGGSPMFGRVPPAGLSTLQMDCPLAATVATLARFGYRRSRSVARGSQRAGSSERRPGLSASRISRRRICSRVAAASAAVTSARPITSWLARSVSASIARRAL